MQGWASATFGRVANLTGGPLSQSRVQQQPLGVLADSSEGEWLSPPQRDWPTTAEIRTKNRRHLSTAGATASIVDPS